MNDDDDDTLLADATPVQLASALLECLDVAEGAALDLQENEAFEAEVRAQLERLARALSFEAGVERARLRHERTLERLEPHIGAEAVAASRKQAQALAGAMLLRPKDGES